mmetsp:Transcript_3661/g.14337  ORF Transcript_3661/g.14337 Transcript_3661/m.14337 type:complete len:243 (-) Transcript_3661:211-939(-)
MVAVFAWTTTTTTPAVSFRMPPKVAKRARTAPPASTARRAKKTKQGGGFAPRDGENTVHARDAPTWKDWLETNGSSAAGVWLVLGKKGADVATVTYDEALDAALCHGWIDSAIRRRDDETHYQYFSRRNPKSTWSRVNKERVARLTASGAMREPGLAAVRLAQQTGTWTALDDVENLVAPADLVEAFAASPPKARAHWEAFPRSVRRAILEWIGTAKKPETRAKRVKETVDRAARNERAHSQ